MEQRVPLVGADERREQHYGVTHSSASIWRVKGSHSPTRVEVWSNVNRPNPHPGQVKWKQFGPIGGDGKYLDPENQGTDDEVTVLLSPESSGIYADAPNTGHEGSGQVWAPEHEPIATGDVLVLVYPDGREEPRTVTLTGNGYGRADLAPVLPAGEGK